MLQQECVMTYLMPRRRFIEGAGLIGGAAVAAGVLPVGAAYAQGQPAGGAKPPSYAPKPLPIDPTKIHGISQRVLTSHYENNYVGAVKRLNAITEQLAGLDFDTAPVFVVNGLKREELIAMNSMILHELYFSGLGGSGEPGGELAEALKRDFGGVDKWRSHFVATGKALGGGSGWVILNYSPRDRRLVNQWASDHSQTLAAGRPILVLDMYEHAYQMDYGAQAGSYVDAFMQAINWRNAAQLYGEARGSG
jgi:Fe-Mn family superoxide dismutase